MSNNLRRALFVRLDKIGDLILTVPVDQSLPQTEVHWWIPKGLSFITAASIPPRKSLEKTRKIGVSDFFRTLKEIRRENYDLAVVFHAPWWVGFLLWLARVPVRIGVRSQWHSFLFFNRGVRQRRSLAEFSELEYNHRLIEDGLGLSLNSLQRNHLSLHSQQSLSEQTHLLKQFNLEPFTYTVVHVGMAGSALNWPTEHYAELIHRLSLTETVAMTGTAADELYLKPLREKFSQHPRVIWLDGKLNGKELITVLVNAKQVVAPSTGVMHLAASTGQPTLGLFSPVRVQQPRRWGPQGSRAITLMPQVDCPGELSCLGERCMHFPCMQTITPQDALDSLQRLT